MWPAGPLQAYQDGNLVGRSDWQPAEGEKFEIAMGRDDLMHVDIETPGTFTQAKGVFGGSVERTSTAVYAIVNQPSGGGEGGDAGRGAGVAQRGDHRHAQVRPGARDHRLEQGDRRRPPGRWTCAGKGTRRVSVSHSVTAPKGAAVANLP